MKLCVLIVSTITIVTVRLIGWEKHVIRSEFNRLKHIWKVLLNVNQVYFQFALFSHHNWNVDILFFKTYNACAFFPCQNEATCQTTPPSHDYTCQCVPGFTGSDCETNIDDCVDHTCPNHTVCVDRIQNYTCECRIGKISLLYSDILICIDIF